MSNASEIFQILNALDNNYSRKRSLFSASLEVDLHKLVTKLQNFEDDIPLLLTTRSEKGNTVFFWLAIVLWHAEYQGNAANIERLQTLWLQLLDKVTTPETINALFQGMVKAAEDGLDKGINAFYFLAAALHAAALHNNIISTKQLQRVCLVLLDKTNAPETINVLFQGMMQAAEDGPNKGKNALYWLMKAFETVITYGSETSIKQLQNLWLLFLEKAPFVESIGENFEQLLWRRDKFVESLLAQVAEMGHLGNLDGALRRLENASNPETVLGRFFYTHHGFKFGQTNAIKLINAAIKDTKFLIQERDGADFVTEGMIPLDSVNSTRKPDSLPGPDSAAELLAVLGAIANRGKGPAPAAIESEFSAATPAIAAPASSPSA